MKTLIEAICLVVMISSVAAMGTIFDGSLTIQGPGPKTESIQPVALSTQAAAKRITKTERISSIKNLKMN
jgi:hypothetical protein